MSGELSAPKTIRMHAGMGMGTEGSGGNSAPSEKNRNDLRDAQATGQT